MNFAIIHKHKLIIGLTAKSGCTHIKHLGFKIAYGHRHKHREAGRIHFNPRWKSLVAGPETNLLSRIKNNVKLKEYTVVGIMRNPYERLVSGFLDKYQPPNICRKKGGEFWGRFKSPRHFKKFTNHLLRNDWRTVDQAHFKTQINNIDHLLEIKDLVHDFRIWDLKNIDYDFLNKHCEMNDLSMITKGPHQRDKKPLKKWNENTDLCVSELPMSKYIEYNVPYNLFYTPDIKQKIKKYFHRDLKFAEMQNIVYDI